MNGYLGHELSTWLKRKIASISISKHVKDVFFFFLPSPDLCIDECKTSNLLPNFSQPSWAQSLIFKKRGISSGVFINLKGNLTWTSWTQFCPIFSEFNWIWLSEKTVTAVTAFHSECSSGCLLCCLYQSLCVALKVPLCQINLGNLQKGIRGKKGMKFNFSLLLMLHSSISRIFPITHLSAQTFWLSSVWSWQMSHGCCHHYFMAVYAWVHFQLHKSNVAMFYHHLAFYKFKETLYKMWKTH